MVGYRFLDDLAFSEEQKEVMSKHSDLREVGSNHLLYIDRSPFS